MTMKNAISEVWVGLVRYVAGRSKGFAVEVGVHQGPVDVGVHQGPVLSPVTSFPFLILVMVEVDESNVSYWITFHISVSPSLVVSFIPLFESSVLSVIS